MDKLQRINELFIKGHIDQKTYEALYEKHAPKPSPVEQIISTLAAMNLEELLDTYKDGSTIAETSLLRLLILAELDKRING